ncbi:hypothetical protein A2U01_0038731, partial [Trifolium medium]|nr:hypothetical protein [Trifolium medium]
SRKRSSSSTTTSTVSKKTKPVIVTVTDDDKDDEGISLNKKVSTYARTSNTNAASQAKPDVGSSHIEKEPERKRHKKEEKANLEPPAVQAEKVVKEKKKKKKKSNPSPIKPNPTTSTEKPEEAAAKEQGDKADKTQDDISGHKLESSNSCLDPSQPK